MSLLLPFASDVYKVVFPQQSRVSGEKKKGEARRSGDSFTRLRLEVVDQKVTDRME